MITNGSPDRLCACGCGQIALKRSDYARGHWTRTEKGRAEISARQHRNGRTVRPDGYVAVRRERELTREHVAVAEKALGRRLPPKAEVHHVDENRANNAGSNLVICPNRSYHQLLHRRADAFDTCGHADWRKCNICGQYDAPENLYISPASGSAIHRACSNALRRRKYAKAKKLGGTERKFR